jgi:flagellar protein FlgJ
MLSAASVAQLYASAGSSQPGFATAGATSGGAMTEAQADKVSKDFESMFVGQMLEQMFGDSLGADAFGDEQSADVYKSLMMDAYGKEIAKSGGIGIASYVKRELLKLQETGQ